MTEISADDWLVVESVSIGDDDRPTVHISRVRIGEVFSAPAGCRVFEATTEAARRLVRLTLRPEHPAVKDAEGAVNGT